MKRILTTMVLASMAILVICAQEKVTFIFSEGLYKENLKKTAEQNISQLLTNINAAAESKSVVSFNGVKISEQAKHEFLDLWEFMPFSCDDAVNVEKCLQTVTGYQVRGLPVTILDIDDYNDNPTRELTVSFASDGEITGVFFSLEKHMVNTIMNSGTDVADVRRKEEILNFVERYRSYYDQKDLKAIEDIFSNDAVIITGRMVTYKTPEGAMVKVPEYDEKNKVQYINELRGIFARKKYIKVGFSNIELKRHPTKKNVYLVTLVQDWRTENAYGRVYSDTGYVNLLWEFPENDGDPRIMVRTWEAKDVTPTKRLEMKDFKIPSEGRNK